MGEKTSQNLSTPPPSFCTNTQCLGRPHSLPQMTARWFTDFYTTMQQRSHWLQWDTPNSHPKLPLPLRRSLPPSNTPITRLTRPTIPNGSRIHSAIFPQITFQTDRQTDRQIDTQTGRRSRRMVSKNTDTLAILIDIDALKMKKNCRFSEPFTKNCF